MLCLYASDKALKNLPDQVGVTAKLEIDYRSPTRADQVRILFALFLLGF
jgi:hypothetical protein